MNTAKNNKKHTMCRIDHAIPTFIVTPKIIAEPA